jgi:hypothetical protein
MLKAVEREKLQDCLLLIQSARTILSGMQDTVVPTIGQLEKCFHDADETISHLLRT